MCHFLTIDNIRQLRLLYADPKLVLNVPYSYLLSSHLNLSYKGKDCIVPGRRLTDVIYKTGGLPNSATISNFFSSCNVGSIDIRRELWLFVFNLVLDTRSRALKPLRKGPK